MEERRKTARIRLTFEVIVYDIKTGERVGHLADISTEGIMLVGGRAMKINNVYEFRITLPVSIYGKTEISFNAVCLWSGKVEKSTKYQAGFQIQNPTKELKEMLKYWMQNPSLNK
jgi:hypothetical protein